MDQPPPLARRKTWIRVLYMLFFAAVLHLVELALVVIVVAQTVLQLVRGETFPELRSLGTRLANYTRDIIAFLAFSTESLPYPFTERPEPEPAQAPMGS